MVNLHNFMDGMDGFAGSMAVFGFGALGVLGWRGDDIGFTLANGVVVVAAGFLLFNFPPARIFSEISARPSWAYWRQPCLSSGPGVVCSHYRRPGWRSCPSCGRHLACYAAWYAARSNVSGRHTAPTTYQRLVLTGWSHHRTVLWFLSAAATDVAARDLDMRDQWFLLDAWVVIYLAISIKTRLAEQSADTPAP